MLAIHRIITTLFLIVPMLYSHAQTWQWARNAAGTVRDNAKHVAADAAGNTYVVGCFNSATLDFGSGVILTNAGNYDLFIAKYDANGNILWAQNKNCTGNDIAHSVTVDASSGNIYVIGTFASSNITFGATTLVKNGASLNTLFLVKLDANGNALWAISNPGSTGAIYYGPTYMTSIPALSVVTDGTGNVYISGSFAPPKIILGGITLDYTSVGKYSVFVAKCDANGNVLWVNRAGGAGHCYGPGVAADASGNVYIAGYYSNTITFYNASPITLNATGGQDMFIAKYNTSGVLQWATQGTCAGQDNAWTITTDASGNAIVAGYYNTNAITFGVTTLAVTGGQDLFLTKYDANGNVLWANRSTGCGNDDAITNVKTDASDNIYIAGYYRGCNVTLDGTTLIGSGNYDIMVAKYDANGNILWAQEAGNNISEWGNAVAIDAAGGVYVAGLFVCVCTTSYELAFGSQSIFVTIPAASTDSYDMFIAKLDGGISLPIELLYFSANLLNNQMILCEWETATEINNDYFTVEKIDREEACCFSAWEWQTVDTIKGAGNSNTPLKYSAVDKSPYQGTSYYRLKQVDFNGDSSYSDIRAVNLEGIDIINLLPNPAEKEIMVLLYSTEKTKVNVNIYNILGQKMYVGTQNFASIIIAKGTNNIKLDVSTFSTGYYLLEIETESGSYRVLRKLIKN